MKKRISPHAGAAQRLNPMFGFQMNQFWRVCQRSFLSGILCAVFVLNNQQVAATEKGSSWNTTRVGEVPPQISLTITSSFGKPLNGVTIKNMQGNSEVKSNAQGLCTIAAKTGDVLVVFLQGYQAQTVQVSKTMSLRLVLLKDGEKIAAGKTDVEQLYASKARHLTLAATTTLDGDDVIKSPVISVKTALTGRMAGLYTLQSSGAPGNDGVSMNVRGMEPLVLIDGVPTGISVFNPEDVASVTLVKDALGTAMLGVRSSNGALLITTKKGKADKLQISATVQSAIQQPRGYAKTVNSFQYATMYNEALTNDGLTPIYTQADLDAYQNGTDPYRRPDVDWRNALLSPTSLFNRYSVNASGGDKNARYFVSIEHVNQSGFFKTVDSNKYNTNNNFQSFVIRSNVDVNVNSKITGGIYLLGRILNGNEPGATTGSILSGILNTPNNAYPILNPNGSFAGNSQFQNNLWAQTIAGGYRQNYKRDVLSTFYLKRTLDEIAQGLWIQVKTGLTATLSENVTRTKSFATYLMNVGTVMDTTYSKFGSDGLMGNSNGIGYQGRSDYEEVSLGYDRTFAGMHHVNVLALANRDNSVTGSDLPYTITGTSGRFSYDYKGKYVMEATLAYNGSNRYPTRTSYKRGYFPAVGLGWNIDREAFLQNQQLISRLKVFGSYGKTGWNDNGYFTYFQRFFDANSVIFGTSAASNTAITEQPLANPFITWEKANKLNVGIDGSLFQDRLEFKAEYYKNQYYDLLMQRGRSTGLLGNVFPNENIGKSDYSGLEFQLGWKDAIKDFQYFIMMHAALPQNKVVFMDEVYRDYEWMKRTGRMIGQRFGYVAEGLYKDATDAANSASTTGYTPQAGDIKYKDLNGDGLINQLDIAPIGKTTPAWFFGLNAGFQFKGFDMSALIQGVQNRDVYLNDAGYVAFQNGGFGQAYQENLNRWTPATASTASYPRLWIGNNPHNLATSSYWIKDGSYIRLKQVEIGYTLPSKISNRAKLQSVRVFAMGYNVWTLTAASLGDRDPEIYGGSSYPLQRLVNFGLNIKL